MDNERIKEYLKIADLLNEICCADSWTIIANYELDGVTTVVLKYVDKFHNAITFTKLKEISEKVKSEIDIDINFILSLIGGIYLITEFDMKEINKLSNQSWD